MILNKKLPEIYTKAWSRKGLDPKFPNGEVFTQNVSEQN